MSHPNAGKIAWITGAGKGIGRALALKLSAHGWTLAVSARTETDLQTLCEEAPGPVHAYPLDISDAELTAKVIKDIESDIGEIDLAVLNAGTHQAEKATELSIANTRHLMEVNFMGTINGLAPLIELFAARRRGHLAVVASLAGYRGLPSAAAYGASKAALINLCESLRPELEEVDVRLSLINPGFVETPLTDRNEFDMPFLISTEKAAQAIIRGLEGSAFEITMPRRFAFIMKFMRIMPYWLFFALTRRMVR